MTDYLLITPRGDGSFRMVETITALTDDQHGAAWTYALTQVTDWRNSLGTDVILIGCQEHSAKSIVPPWWAQTESGSTALGS